ncbi:MAG: methylated-DNA--[protein]-cysteine S-methyltransferase [Candidatus Cloacimonadaceae bacterium]|jgi:methylated-DNA-[protein]-cysteine S-methyltransferase|nr:methylated-DNA--[protein]-cysteine S-methyltransferase [Candidatus Cloacimonadota bacterium]MDD4559949.1 methylated-DNA--[protein]-cysteine S-methyltransferase [Candidatus Cloacimonadota bacterium]
MLRILYYERTNICLEIAIEEETITRIVFCKKALNHLVENDFEREVLRQFDEYFAGDRCEFDLPFFATGTPFQLMVWEQLLKIAYGETVSYKELASRIGKPNAQRAVGNALNKNKIVIIVPCHRVIASDGSQGGFGGDGSIKKMLLDLEHKFKVGL